MTNSASPRDKDLVKLMKLLRELAPREVEALNRFYLEEQQSTQIAADLGITISHLRELKTRLKQAYLAERLN